MKVDVNTGTHIDVSLEVGRPVSILKTIMKKHERVERSYSQCGSFCKQQK